MTIRGAPSRRLVPIVWMMLGVALFAPGCGTKQPTSVSLAALASDQENYQGEEVRTQGMVRRFTDPSGPYFVIEGAHQDRVKVVPASLMVKYEGRRVEVIGTFHVNQAVGRLIRVKRLSIWRVQQPVHNLATASR